MRTTKEVRVYKLGEVVERVCSRPVLDIQLILSPNKLYFNPCEYLKVLKAWQEPHLQI